MMNSQLGSQISAFINGVHLGQVLLREQNKRGDPRMFSRGGLSVETVTQLCVSFQELLTHPPLGGTANIERLNKFRLPASPRLPVNVLTAFLQERTGRSDEMSVRAIANLCQLCLEVNKDGTVLQDLFRFYLRNGLRISFTQLGFDVSDADFLNVGKQLAAKTGKCPYSTDALAWQIALRKVENWAQKISGRRNKFTLAQEIWSDEETSAYLPPVDDLRSTRLGILGHSMTMSAHWSSAGSWCEVAAEVMRMRNPQFEYRGFQEGSFTPSRAVVSKLDSLLAYKPTDAIVLLLVHTPEDRVALEVILRELRAIGCRVFVVDEVRPWFKEKDYPRFASAREFERYACKKFGARLLEFYDLGRTVKGFREWECLDKVHMVTEGHVFYAKQLLKIWAAERRQKKVSRSTR